MSDFLPREVRDGLNAAQAGRLTARAGGAVIPILSHDARGFGIAGRDAGRLRGLVDIYDGPRHLTRCLVVASGEEGGVMRFEYKSRTPASDDAPVDFVRGRTPPPEPAV